MGIYPRTVYEQRNPAIADGWSGVEASLVYTSMLAFPSLASIDSCQSRPLDQYNGKLWFVFNKHNSTTY